MNNHQPIFSVSDFVAVFNQTLEFAYPSVTIVGELANFRINKGQWLRFDLKDDDASVNFFGTVYNLPGPLEEGMLLKVRGSPRLHPRYGFSVNIQSIELSGEGTIKRAFALLEAKLTREGLFNEERKRPLPYPPTRLGLITSAQSAAYADFCKILGSRWGGVSIELFDVQVQGETAVSQIIQAIEYFNAEAEPPEVLIITRGGGSADDLSAFNTEQVVRAIAASRVPTLVAIGHETDVSLAEKAADKRASTPSNAAELLVPDKSSTMAEIKQAANLINRLSGEIFRQASNANLQSRQSLAQLIKDKLNTEKQRLQTLSKLLLALSPAAILERGYVVVRDKSSRRIIKSVKSLKPNKALDLEFADGVAVAITKAVE